MISRTIVETLLMKESEITLQLLKCSVNALTAAELQCAVSVWFAYMQCPPPSWFYTPLKEWKKKTVSAD